MQQGIVIEDVSASTDKNVQGSQFVWIPVGQFKKDDGTMSNEIVLGRYTFNTSNGTPILQQAAYTNSNPENYKKSVTIEDNYIELATYRAGVANSNSGTNATAYNLSAWIESVKENGGDYIGRYEASYASGSSYQIGGNGYKAASKVSASYSVSIYTAFRNAYHSSKERDIGSFRITLYFD